MEQFRINCFELCSAGRTCDVKKASDYFLSLQSRPSEALQLSYSMLQRRDENVDVWLLASQILVSAASKSIDTAMMEAVCNLASSGCAWKRYAPVRSQVCLAVACLIPGSSDARELVASVGRKLERDSDFFIEILGLIPEVILKHRTSVSDDLHAAVAEILEASFERVKKEMTASSANQQQSLSCLAQILQSVMAWLELAEGNSTLSSQWVGIAIVRWSFDVLGQPQWLHHFLSAEGDESHVKFYWKALELLSSVCQSLDRIPRSDEIGHGGSMAMAYSEQCLSLIAHILSVVASSGAQLRSGDEEEGTLKSLLIMLCSCSSGLLSTAMGSGHYDSTQSTIFTYLAHFDKHLQGYLHFVAAKEHSSAAALDLLVCVADDLCSSVCEALNKITPGQLPMEGVMGPMSIIEDSMLRVAHLAIQYSCLDQDTCTVKLDPTSEIGPRYDQGEGGDFRKRLRDSLRVISRTFSQLPLSIANAVKQALSLYISDGAAQKSSTWSCVEVQLHAYSAILKVGGLSPLTMLEVVTLAIHPSIMECRPLARFAVVIIGESIPLLVQSDLPTSAPAALGMAINGAFRAVTDSCLIHMEEAPARIYSAGVLPPDTPGRWLAFRLKEDHIGIVSLCRLLGCLPPLSRYNSTSMNPRATVSVAAHGQNRITLPDDDTTAADADPRAILTMVVSAYWALLDELTSTSPNFFIKATFKSFLVATEGVVRALSTTLTEGYLLVPIMAALVREEPAAMSTLAAHCGVDVTSLFEASSCLQRLPRALLLHLMCTCMRACRAVWRMLSSCASISHRLQVVASLMPVIRSMPVPLDSQGLLGCCNLLVHLAGLLQDELEAPGEEGHREEEHKVGIRSAEPIFRQIAGLALNLHSAAMSSSTTAGGTVTVSESLVEARALLSTVWKSYVAFLCGTGLLSIDHLPILQSITLICCDFLQISTTTSRDGGGEGKVQMQVTTSTSLNRALFSLLLALMQLQHLSLSAANNGPNPNAILLDEACIHAVTHALLVALVVKQCASERDAVLEILRVVFIIYGKAQSVSLLVKALQVEPRVIPVSHKGSLRAVESLAGAAEKNDWKKFKSAARQLAK